VSDLKYYYDSSKRPHPFWDEIQAVFKYKDLLVLFISRSLKTRYKRSSLGVLWTLMNPMATMIVFTLVFSRIWRFDIPSYPVYVLSGLVVWNFFSYATKTSMSDMVFQGDLIKRIFVPRSLFVLSASGTGFINLLISVIPLLAIAMVLGVRMHWSVLYLPISLLVLLLYTVGLGLILTAGAVFFSDLIPLFDVVLRIWFYATPLFYPISIIPAEYLWLFKMNPMYYMVNIFRTPILEGRVPDLNEMIIAAAWGVGLSVVGWLFFTSRSNEFSYRA
jgi:ABC-type polysaccharide/polyol phosphate export permease